MDKEQHDMMEAIRDLLTELEEATEKIRSSVDPTAREQIRVSLLETHERLIALRRKTKHGKWRNALNRLRESAQGT